MDNDFCFEYPGNNNLVDYAAQIKSCNKLWLLIDKIDIGLNVSNGQP